MGQSVNSSDESRVHSDQNSNRLQLILDPTSLPQEPPSWEKNEEDLVERKDDGSRCFAFGIGLSYAQTKEFDRFLHLNISI